MTSTESLQVVKKVNDAAKKSPLKVVSPILKKYTGHRQGKIKNKLKFPRVLHGGRTKQSPIKPQLKVSMCEGDGKVILHLSLMSKQQVFSDRNCGDQCYGDNPILEIMEMTHQLVFH